MKYKQRFWLEPPSEKKLKIKHLLVRFHRELADIIQTKVSIEHCFCPSILNSLEPNHFPLVFWKPKNLYDFSSWQIADQIIPLLYHKAIQNISSVYSYKDERNLVAIINYAIWKRKFSWLYSLASLFCQKQKSNDSLFQIVSLLFAYQSNQRLSKFYASKIKKSSLLYSLFYQYLSNKEDLSDANQLTKEEDHLPIEYYWFQAKIYEHSALKKECLARMCDIELVEEEVFKHYNLLISSGHLYIAQRLLIRYLKKYENSEHSLYPLLQLYFQNGKYYPYLLCLKRYEIWPDERVWYEVVYSIQALGIESQRKKIWNILIRNKKRLILPSLTKRKNFYTLLSNAKDNAVLSSQDNWQTLDILPYLNFPTSKPQLLKNKYQIINELVLEKTQKNIEIDPTSLYPLSSSLFWTLYLYMKEEPSLKFLSLLKSLAGSNLAFRYLLSVLLFQKKEYYKSKKLLSFGIPKHPIMDLIKNTYKNL